MEFGWMRLRSCFSMFLLPGLWFAGSNTGGVCVFSKFVSPMAAGFANAILCCPSQGSSTKPRSLKDLEPALLTKSIWAQDSGQQLCSESQISTLTRFCKLLSDFFAQKVLGQKASMMNLILEASFEHHATCVLSVLSIYILPYPSPDRGSLHFLEKVTDRCSYRNINQSPEAELRTQPDTDVSRDG